MKATQYISRGIASLLLVVMLHSHFCAAICASGVYSCCDEKQEVKDCCKKSCCDTEKKKEPCNDCQKEHLSFFSTIGQFHFIKVDAAKVFQPLFLIQPKEIIAPVVSYNIAFAYTGFRPPPPKENIIVLNQSFLI